MQLCEDLPQQGCSAPPQAETTGTALYCQLNKNIFGNSVGTVISEAENLDPGTGLTWNLKTCRYLYLIR